MKKMDLDGTLAHRVGKDVSPKTPGRAYPYLLRLVQFLEKELPDVPHYYKGGFFIGEYTKEPRYTQDVDMSVMELSAYERVKDVLRKLGDELVASGEISKYVVKEQASERSSGGAKYYAPEGSILFSVDIGYQETPCTTVALDMDDVGNIRVSTVEQMLSDKLSALFSDRRLRRIKDIYDAWHILTHCDVDMNKVILCLDRRGLYPLSADMVPLTDERLPAIQHAYESLAIYSRATNMPVAKPDFFEVAQVVGAFYSNITDAEV